MNREELWDIISGKEYVQHQMQMPLEGFKKAQTVVVTANPWDRLQILDVAAEPHTDDAEYKRILHSLLADMREQEKRFKKLDEQLKGLLHSFDNLNFKR